MADLHLHVGGDSNEAQDALHGAGSAAHEAHDAMHELSEKLKDLKESFAVGTLAAEGFEKVLEFTKEVLKDSYNEYVKAETAHRQLALAAGELTEQFERQAKVISENLAVKDEEIERMQMLLLRYGAAPQTIGDVIMAVENMAATGKDANMVLQTMINASEHNTGSLGKLGVEFEKTGGFATNLAKAAEAVNKQFDGIAQAAADSPEGQQRSAKLAVEELEKALGGLFAKIESKLHVLSTFTAYMKALADGDFAHVALGDLWNREGGGKEEVPTVGGPSGPYGGVPTLGQAMNTSLSFGSLTMSSNAGSNRQAQRLDEQYQTALQKQSDYQHKLMEDEENFDIEQENKEKQRTLKNLEAIDEMDKQAIKGFEKIEEENRKMTDLATKTQTDVLRHQTDEQAEELKKREHMWVSLGERIGTALIDGIFGSLQGKSSESQNAWKMVGDMVRGIAEIAVSLVTQYLGIGFVGQGFNSFLEADVKSGQSFGPSSHAGSWQRYHSGGWPGLHHDERPAILQVGERVLSRGEVSRMGGAGAVDSAARGGGTTLNVYAWDSENMLDTFAKKGGRAMLNTVRTGKGPMRELLGGG